MRLKFLTFMAAFFILFSSTATSWASDTPLLTWERGKVQNLVLGSPIGSAPLNISFTSQSGAQIKFLPSKPNSQGFRVYSVNLPADEPLGVYKIQAYADNSAQPITVGLVSVISAKFYTITQIPTDLRYILLTLCFITVTFAVMRNRKYSQLSYSRRTRLDENGSIVHDPRFSRVLYRLYKLRSAQGGDKSRTLFGFLLQRSGQLFHEISPFGWCLGPGVGAVAGFFGALAVPHGLLIIPISIMAVYSLLGLFDPLTGFFTGLGFAVFEILAGHVTNLHEVVVLISLCIAWCLPAIIGELILFSIVKDRFFKTQIETIYPVLAASVVVGICFDLLQNLIRSVSESLWPNRIDYQFLSIFLAAGFFLKSRILSHILKIAEKQNIELLEEKYQIKVLLSQSTIGGLILFFLVLGFIWTNYWKTAFWVALELSAPFFLLKVRWKTSKFGFLARWRRDISIEALAVVLTSSALIWLVTQLPYTIYDKSLIVIFISLAPVLLHAILSNLYEAVTERQED